MPNKCSVPGCSGRGGSGSGFQFPSDPDLRQRWIKAVNRQLQWDGTRWEPSKSSKVCAAHFKQDDFKVPVFSTVQVGGKSKMGLKSGAVPSLFGEECNMIVVEGQPVIGAPKEDETESKFVPSMPTTTSNSVTQTVLKKEAAGAPKPYPCQICCENLNSLDEVYEHLQKSHGYADKVYLCRLCHYTSPNRSLWFSHYSRCQSFNHLICPEPGCDYVSEERQEIERHMMCDHMSVKYASLKLFFCPTCSQNLELKDREEYEEHLIWCGQSQTFPSLSIEEDEPIQHPALSILYQHPAQPLANVTPDPSCGNERPNFSYSKMIAEALNQAENEMMSLYEIMIYISRRYPFYRMDVKGWQNAIRHNLSVNPRFNRVPNSKSNMGSGNLWTMKEKPEWPIGGEKGSHLLSEERRVPVDNIVSMTGEAEDVEEIKCHMCEFSLRCEYSCEGVFRTTSALRQNARHKMSQHFSEVHNLKNMKICETRGCDFRSQDRILRMKHKRKEAGRTQCEVCGITVSAYRIDKHMMTHSDLTFDCDYCSRPYGDHRALKKHLFKHHGKEAYAKYVENIHKHQRDPGVCQVCGKAVENRRVHLIAWHPDVAAPKTFKTDLSKGTRKLSQKPRWAERLNKRQKVLSEQGILPPTLDESSEVSNDMLTQ